MESEAAEQLALQLLTDIKSIHPPAIDFLFSRYDDNDIEKFVIDFFTGTLFVLASACSDHEYFGLEDSKYIISVDEYPLLESRALDPRELIFFLRRLKQREQVKGYQRRDEQSL
jgi:hypothetical protein